MESRFDRRVMVSAANYNIFHQMCHGDKRKAHQAINQALGEFIAGRISVYDKATNAVIQSAPPQKVTKKRSVPSSWLS